MIVTSVPAALPPRRLRTRTLLPVVQGGMGMGVSAHWLAGSVAALGAVGTISSDDLRHHHPDLMARAGHCTERRELDRSTGPRSAAKSGRWQR
jgi:nitronate monooxygenase